MAALSEDNERLPRITLRNVSAQRLCSRVIDSLTIELLRPGTCSGTACCNLTELPSDKAAPSVYGQATPHVHSEDENEPPLPCTHFVHTLVQHATLNGHGRNS